MTKILVYSNRLKSLALLGCFLMGSSLSLAMQPAIAVKDTNILDAPQRTAKVQGELKEGANIDILKRKGGWYQVRLNEQATGWVPLLSLRFENEDESNEQTIADILRQTAEMPTSAGVTSGVRGMSTEQLEGEPVNPKEGHPSPLDRMERYIPTLEDLNEFQEEGGLEQQPDIPLY